MTPDLPSDDVVMVQISNNGCAVTSNTVTRSLSNRKSCTAGNRIKYINVSLVYRTTDMRDGSVLHRRFVWSIVLDERPQHVVINLSAAPLPVSDFVIIYMKTDFVN